jgi:DNA polymerase delta subunit OB-fold domain
MTSFRQHHSLTLRVLRTLTGRRCQSAVEGVLNLPEGQECCVIGTVYKEMKLKPNILDEYVKVALVTWASCQVHLTI